MQDKDPKFLERWANVYTLARSIPDDVRFNIQHWGIPNEISECNTAACLAGHAALHPWFRDRGLSTSVKTGIDHVPYLHICMAGEEGIPQNYSHPWIKVFFGVSVVFDNGLPFWPDSYVEEVLATDDEVAVEEYEELEIQEETHGRLVTPSMTAKKTYDWMTMWWSIGEVDAAIAKAEAVYNMEAVHRYTPWNQENASV